MRWGWLWATLNTSEDPAIDWTGLERRTYSVRLLYKEVGDYRCMWHIVARLLSVSTYHIDPSQVSAPILWQLSLAASCC